MGLLVDGVWHDDWYDTESTGGRFERPETVFRRWIEPDGDFPAVTGRYHLYISLACPWAHRTLIVRKLKGLEPHIGLSVVHPTMGSGGWHFDGGYPEATDEPLYGLAFMHELYQKADPHYTGRVTVPVLWDCERETIVSNESADLVRMLNRAFNALPGVDDTLDLYPGALASEIDALNERIYHAVNNGVYKSGFATAQAVYEREVTALFNALDELEARLGEHRYLTGEAITEADWRLFTTLVRFDAVYVGHFKCNLRRIDDYPHLRGYLRDLYQQPGIAETVSLDHIKRHYYTSHPMINPTGIIPAGPVLDLDAPHGRGA
ncbi:glutathione S-transferase [Spiribacter salinus M19-40]|jgi:putative glutathione S-transferase|uniref:Glutathione S-transferase n=1 Tax=Spiribacter salinus M19-40 TaxID=1260251 RepID=R4VHP0_9GAMM|nr:glutathione S-transferase family protein [Spiribacter salinus]AGM41691.1 glutathione S-transferase [Spiribacter salinus M19-40]MBY5268758.1 glutathione-dependent reductase [Spiribacter salinus]